MKFFWRNTAKTARAFEVTGEIGGKSLNLQFKSLDYLDRPVPAQKVDFTTQIVARSKPRNGVLNGDEFAYAGTPNKDMPRFEDLGEDDQLLALAYGVPAAGSKPGSILWEERKEVKLNGRSAGEYSLAIPEQYKQGRYALLVRAILIDANGRELRHGQVDSSGWFFVGIEACSFQDGFFRR